MSGLIPISHRVLSELVGHRVSSGESVTVPVHRIMVHDGTGPAVARTLERHGITDLRGAPDTVMVFDHYYPATSEAEAALHLAGRRFATTHGIPLYEGEGIAHQLLPERGLLAPGTVYVGADSHSCTAGAFGVMGIGLGVTDVAAVIASGRLWIEVPEVMRVQLFGTLPDDVDPGDLALHLAGRIGAEGARGKVLEFVGPAVGELDISTRMKIANFTVEMGAVAGMFGVDTRCARWLEARGADLAWRERVPHDATGADADLQIDLGEILRVVALPHRPDRVRPLGSGTTRVDQVFIGSCAGGRFADLEVAASVIQEAGGISPGVRLLIGPASREVLNAARQSGVLDTLLDAGAILLPPGCGACMGRVGALGPGEIAVSTQNRNFQGRVGSARAHVFLASPRTAAEAATTGILKSEVGS